MQIRTSSKRISFLVVVVVLAIVAAGCSGESDDAADAKPTIVVSTTIWGDVVSSLVGDEANVEVLMPTGADPHEFEPSSRQIAAVQSADLVVVNGLGLEEGLIDSIEAAEADGANVLEIAPALTPIPFGDADGTACDPDLAHELDHDEVDHDAEADHDDHDEDLPACDPHVWMDPQRVAIAVGLIVDELEALETDVDWQAAGNQYLAEVADADEEVEQLLATVDPDDRELVTNHESLGYLADRYEYEIIATVIPGGTTLGSSSSAEIATLVAIMEKLEINAIFTDNSAPADLADAVSAELGGDVAVVELFTGSLGGPDSGAQTLIDLWVTNANRIAGALGS